MAVRVRQNRQVSIKIDDTKLQEIIKANGGKSHIRLIIADGVEYGFYQEMGTTKMPAHPFLIPAFQKVQFGIPPAIGRAIEANINPFDLMRKFAFDIQALAQKNAPVDTGALKNSLHVEEE